MQNFAKRHVAADPTQQLHNGQRQMDPNRVQATQHIRFSAPRTGSPAGMRPPARPSTNNGEQSAPNHRSSLSVSSYPPSTNGSSTESDAPRANSQKPRARGNPQHHEFHQLAAGPSSDDVDDSDQEEQEDEYEIQGTLQAMYQPSQGRDAGAWLDNTESYDSHSNMDNEDITIRNDILDNDPTKYVELAKTFYKGDLYKEHQLGVASRQQEPERQPTAPAQHTIVQEQQVVRQPNVQQQSQQKEVPTQPHGLAQLPGLSRTQTPNPHASLFGDVPNVTDELLHKHDTVRDHLSPVIGQSMPQRPASAGLPSRTPWAANSERHSERTKPSLPQKRPAPDTDYSQEALRSMKYEELAAESFEDDPAAPTTALDVFNELPLSQGLSHMLRQQPQEQDNFLASLPLQQWQEAGEWFKVEIAKLNERMMESRDKRREIGRRYENDVEKRYNEVMKERSVYEKALSGMAFSGQTVITQGTPRRKK